MKNKILLFLFNVLLSSLISFNSYAMEQDPLPFPPEPERFEQSIPLSNDCLSLIFSNINEPKDLVNLFLVNKKLREKFSNFCFSLDFSKSENKEDVSDDFLAFLVKHCPNIQVLNLDGCKRITPRGFTLLAGLKSLRNLSLVDCPNLTDKCLQCLARINSLENLNISLISPSFNHGYSCPDQALPDEDGHEQIQPKDNYREDFEDEDARCSAVLMPIGDEKNEMGDNLTEEGLRCFLPLVKIECSGRKVSTCDRSIDTLSPFSSGSPAGAASPSSAASPLFNRYRSLNCSAFPEAEQARPGVSQVLLSQRLTEALDSIGEEDEEDPE